MTNGYDRNEQDPTTEGPFPNGLVHEHPWDATETDRGPFERRRAVDRRAPDFTAEADAGTETPEEAEGRRRRWGRRKADVLNTGASGLSGDSRRLVRRLREPLIGLTLAGVAAPLINAGVNPGENPGQIEDESAAAAGTALAEGTDLDTAVGEAWAEAEEASVRDATIDGAVARYGIDQQLAEEIYEAAGRYEIEPDMAFGLVNTESTFRERAVSHVGARGLTQVMPRTAKWLDPTISTSELFDRDRNLDLGFKYLRMMIDKYGGNVENALTAYNRGPGTVDKILKRGGNPDNGYAGKVLGG